MREPKPNFVAEYYMVQLYGRRSTFVMVEGKTDEEIWGCFGATKCRFFPSLGKDNIVEALTISELSEMPGTAGIIDLDYSLVSGTNVRNIPNLLYDLYYPDLEMILLNSSDSSALNDVFSDTLTDYEPEQLYDWTHTLLNAAQNLAMEFGYFRWLNDCNDYGIDFRSFEYNYQPGFINFGESDFIDIDALELRRKWIARRLAGSSSDQISWEDLLQETAELRDKHPPNNKQLCRGKDVIAIIAFILPRLYHNHFGAELPSSSKEAFREMRLAKELRNAYKCSYFKQTSLYDCIRSWEDSNTPYKILKLEN